MKNPHLKTSIQKTVVCFLFFGLDKKQPGTGRLRRNVQFQDLALCLVSLVCYVSVSGTIGVAPHGFGPTVDMGQVQCVVRQLNRPSCQVCLTPCFFSPVRQVSQTRILSTSLCPLEFRFCWSWMRTCVPLGLTSSWATRRPSRQPLRKWMIKGK